MDFLSVVRVALLALLRNKMRSTLTILGIIIGVGAVICTVAIGQGGQAQVQGDLAGQAADHDGQNLAVGGGEIGCPARSKRGGPVPVGRHLALMEALG